MFLLNGKINQTKMEKGNSKLVVGKDCDVWSRVHNLGLVHPRQQRLTI